MFGKILLIWYKVVSKESVSHPGDWASMKLAQTFSSMVDSLEEFVGGFGGQQQQPTGTVQREKEISKGWGWCSLQLYDNLLEQLLFRHMFCMHLTLCNRKAQAFTLFSFSYTIFIHSHFPLPQFLPCLPFFSLFL